MGTDAVEMNNLAHLVGRHVGFANALLRKYDAGEVHDIVEYLRAEWASAIFHDRWAALTLHLRSIVEGDADAAALLSRVETAMLAPDVIAQADGPGPGSSKADIAIERFRASEIGICGSKLAPGLRRAIEHAVLGFLREHHHILPMFHVPPQSAVA